MSDPFVVIMNNRISLNQGKGRKDRGMQGMAKKGQRGVKFRGRGTAPLYFGLVGTLFYTSLVST